MFSNSSFKTVKKLNLDDFMGDWFVQAGRFTPLETQVHNALETYVWNDKKSRIDISFTYNKGSLNGPLKSIPQKGWVHNKNTNAHWKVSPLWPLKFHYLVVALCPDFSWTAVGVPKKNFLWIMTREKIISNQKLNAIILEVKKANYPIENLTLVPHSIN